MGFRSMPYTEAEGKPQFAGMGVGGSGSGGGGGGGGGSIPTITDTERVIAHYNNGVTTVDLYEARITIPLNFMGDEREYNLSDYGVTNVDDIRNYSAIAEKDGKYYNVEYFDNSSTQIRCWFVSKTKVRISSVLSAVYNGNIHITMQYTKTA